MRGTYDFETYEWTNPLCCGLLVSDRFTFVHEQRRHDKSESILKCIRPARAGVALQTLRSLAFHTRHDAVEEWWAHNGGGFDALILLQEALKQRWPIKAIPASGRLIHMEVCVELDGQEIIVTLKDSYAVVQSKLSKAAKDFALGVNKEFDAEDYKGDMRALPIERLYNGCRADCVTLARLLDTVESLLVRHDGMLKSTFSSCALSAVKASLTKKGEKLPEIPVELQWVNETAREAFYGGRVEVYHHSPKGEVTEYDVLSSYPFAMSKNMPWRFMCRESRGNDAWEDCDGFGYFHVDVPPMAIPPLPFRDKDGGLFFPVGAWNGWFPYNEIRYARELGCTATPLETYNFTTEETPFADFINGIYEEKRNAVGAVRSLAKLIMNGCYGKFAQRPEKETLHVFKTEAEGLDYVMREKCEARKLDGTFRALSVTETQWSRHTHYPIAAYITADARIRLHRLLRLAGRPCYGDTDSVHDSAKTEAFAALCNSDLGGLERKGVYASAEYFAPKLYRIRVPGQISSCGKACNGTLEPHWHNANKGFTIEAVDFDRIVRGEALTQQRMRKAKAQLRYGGDFSRESHLKIWRGKSMKRQPLPDGQTVPWHVRELLENKHKTAMSPLFRKGQS